MILRWGRDMSTKIAGFCVFFLTLFLFVVGLWILYITMASPDSLRPQQAVVFAAIAATAGWIVTAFIARRNSIKQHTMNVLTQIRISAEMNARITTVNAKFPPGSHMSPEYAADTPRTDEVIRAATYVLNYYEFLAAALHHNDLDHNLLKDCVRGQLCSTYEKLRALIDFAVSKDPRGAANSTTYIFLRRLYPKWRHG